MIIDSHTHIWSRMDQLGLEAQAYVSRQVGRLELTAEPGDHALAAHCVDKSLVLGFCSKLLGASIPNEFIARYVKTHSEKMIGIAAVDPAAGDACDQARRWLAQEEFRGLTVSPASQGFHPADSRAMALYELAQEKRAPLFVHHGTHFHPKAAMEFASPLLWDQVAREFPDLTIVLSAMGFPWVEETLALVGKNPRVYTDIAALVRRPWQAYNSLVLAHQFNVTDKLLFGSDFPYFTAAQAIERIYRLHEVTQGTNLPMVPRETLRSIVERNTLETLGIARTDREKTAPPKPHG